MKITVEWLSFFHHYMMLQFLETMMTGQLKLKWQILFAAFDTDSLKVPEVDPTTDENLTASDGASIKSEKVIANYKVEFSQTNPLYTGDHAQ